MNPNTGKPFSTPEIWAKKQIFEKTVTWIENLKNAQSTRPKIGNEAPSIEKIQAYKKLEFRIEETGNKALENAVQNEVNNLKVKYPNWDFSVKYGK